MACKDRDVKVLCVGDLHVKADRVISFAKTAEDLLTLVRSEEPDLVVLLGDLLDGHEWVKTQCAVAVDRLITEMASLVRTAVVIGNHDYINNQQFLSKMHLFNAYKSTDNILVADEVKCLTLRLLFCPYVYPGRFAEAMDTAQDLDWKASATDTVLFAHQEFRGVQMGCVQSKISDVWDSSWPTVISGHIQVGQQSSVCGHSDNDVVRSISRQQGEPNHSEEGDASRGCFRAQDSSSKCQNFGLQNRDAGGDMRTWV